MENEIAACKELIVNTNVLKQVLTNKNEIKEMQKDHNNFEQSKIGLIHTLQDINHNTSLKKDNLIMEKEKLEEHCKHLRQQIIEAKAHRLKLKQELKSCNIITGAEVICEDNVIIASISNKISKEIRYVEFDQNDPHLSDKLWEEVEDISK
ncbi:PREDICTED: uncharacterized protein LOC108567700 [Nicrophorus vespilloides]|uniref:Uncharacterized protein LOC108567700 n=1 Tax=Nicrophorus vespilloides TaxID=110193 RepID=A0ABM1NAE8_NICVS|nr:PREDICTED: uncharacterized protein LOC108567700 [Nicrophorus vespilloides]